MHLKFLRFFIFSILILNFACKPLEDLSPSNRNLELIGKEDFQLLNGTYKNHQDTVFGMIRHSPYRAIEENDRSLIDRLFVFVPDKKGYYKDTSVKIEFISKRSALVKAYRNGSLLFEKKLRGKFKKGYFYVNPRAYIIPFFPLYYVHNFERVRLAKYNGNLIVDHTKMLWGFALMAGGSDYGRSSSIYAKTEKVNDAK